MGHASFFTLCRQIDFFFTGGRKESPEMEEKAKRMPETAAYLSAKEMEKLQLR